jgi:hypothetical protein
VGRARKHERFDAESVCALDHGSARLVAEEDGDLAAQIPARRGPREDLEVGAGAGSEHGEPRGCPGAHTAI